MSRSERGALGQGASFGVWRVLQNLPVLQPLLRPEVRYRTSIQTIGGSWPLVRPHGKTRRSIIPTTKPNPLTVGCWGDTPLITTTCTPTDTVYSVSPSHVYDLNPLSNSSTNVQPTSNGILCNLCYDKGNSSSSNILVHQKCRLKFVGKLLLSLQS